MRCKTCNTEIVIGILSAEVKVVLEPEPETYFYSMIDEGIERAPVGTYVRHSCISREVLYG